MSRQKIMASVAVASGLFMLAQGAARAEIPCDGNFQIVNGQPVATLFCRETNLARVARAYGWHVTEDAIRHSDSTKAQVCRAIGYDSRVQDVCAPFRGDNGAGHGMQF